MINDNRSPEEKLLNLIKGEKKGAPERVVQPALNPKDTIVHDGKKEPSAPQQPISARLKELTLPSLQKLLLVLFVVACLCLIVSLLYPWIALRNTTIVSSKKEIPVEFKLGPVAQTQPLDFYEKAIGNRTLFGQAIGAQAVKPIGAVSADLIKDVALVGIISGANPQAIIEDKASQKTYYVSKGQFIGELQVEDILEGKIILNYNGQRYELYL